jgi:hypothetical protein
VFGAQKTAEFAHGVAVAARLASCAIHSSLR